MTQTFSRFQKLPAELQDMVWVFGVFLQPRVVEVRFARKPNSKKHDFVATIPLYYTPATILELWPSR